MRVSKPWLQIGLVAVALSLVVLDTGSNPAIAGQPGSKIATAPLRSAPNRDLPAGSIRIDLAPLIDASNLVGIFHSDISGRTWTFFDPDPDFASSNSMNSMVPG